MKTIVEVNFFKKDVLLVNYKYTKTYNSDLSIDNQEEINKEIQSKYSDELSEHNYIVEVTRDNKWNTWIVD